MPQEYTRTSGIALEPTAQLTGDRDTYTTSSGPVMRTIASFDPDFTIVAGDLSYAADDGTGKGAGVPRAYIPQR
ncbi:MAG: hypothetical protein ACRDNZ_00210, partial [Streptosporangiaceae bacterium]